MANLRFKQFIIVALSVATMFYAGCKKETSTPKGQELANDLQAIVDKLSKDNSIHGAIVRVTIPKEDFLWQGAVGKASAETPITSDDQFYCASVGKMFTSLLILKMQDEGLLSINDSIGKYLSAAILENLHQFNGHNYSGQITIRQLLQHRSGLDDYFTGGTPNQDGYSPFMQELLANPNYLWTPQEIINYHKKHFTPLAEPGTTYKYSDTGFQLLGLIAEAISKQSFHVVLWQKVLQPLQMEHSYIFGYDEPRLINNRTPSTAYFGTIELTFPAIRCDWAGGGLISNTADLEKGLKAMITGKFLSETSHLEMQTCLPAGTSVTFYGLGISKILYGYGEKEYIIGHDGISGAFLFYSPKHDAYLSGTVNQAQANIYAVLNEILIALEKKR